MHIQPKVNAMSVAAATITVQKNKMTQNPVLEKRKRKKEKKRCMTHVQHTYARGERTCGQPGFGRLAEGDRGARGTR